MEGRKGYKNGWNKITILVILMETVITSPTKCQSNLKISGFKCTIFTYFNYKKKDILKIEGWWPSKHTCAPETRGRKFFKANIIKDKMLFLSLKYFICHTIHPF